MKRNDINILIAVAAVLTAVVMRMVNAEFHLYNFAPVTAIGLFSVAVVRDRKWAALLIPVAGQFVSDLYFQYFTDTPGFYPGQFVNYAALAIAASLGFLINKLKPAQFVAGIFGASGLFFIISNLGYFLSGYNGYSFSGFTKTYIDAIPFYRNAMAGDLIGGVILFGGYFLAHMFFENKLRKAKI